MTGDALPHLQTPIPGPRSREWVDRLAATECPAITARRARRAAVLGAADNDPIVWGAAVGANVQDVDGNIFVDLTAGFGVASVGHRHPAVVAAGQAQLAALPHAMGDAFPDPTRVRLMETLCALTGMDRVILGSSGSDAVDAAVKTARVATGRSHILAFSGGYHGLASGPLAALGHLPGQFREPFAPFLGHHVLFGEYGGDLPDLTDVAAILVEPMQGRGGMRSPPDGWLAAVHRHARNAGTLMIHDEVFTGLGRTGELLATPLKPDLLCIGKALGGGFPISACLGTQAAMDAWGASSGAAIHTQTFLGNPIGCAMALAVLDVLEREDLVSRARIEGARWAEALATVAPVTGRGLFLGLHLRDPLRRTRQLLERGWIVLPAGEGPECIGLTPPLSIAPALLDAFVACVRSL